jgi:hypothetical protein
MSHQLSEHSMRPDMSELFGTLRALMQRAPGTEVWREIVRELGLWEEEERERVAMPYVMGCLKRWPPEIKRWAMLSYDPPWGPRLSNELLTSDVELIRSLLADEAWVAGCRHLMIEEPACEEVLAGHLGRFDQLITLSVRMYKKLGEEAMLRVVSRAWPASLRGLAVDGLADQPEETKRRIVAALAGNASLAGLERLSLMHGKLDLASVEALANSPYLSQLGALTLEGSVLDVASARALANSPYLRRLHTLSLPFCRVDAASARVLAGSPVLETVRSLDVSSNPLRAGLAALLGSPYTRGLTTIKMKNVQLDPAGARALCKVEFSPGLDGFDLNEVHCDRHTFDALAGAPILRLIKKFKWYGRQANQPTGLMASPHLIGLRELELGNADEAVIEAAMNPALSGLETFIIVTREQSARCGVALAQSTFKAGLQRLEVDAWHHGIGALCGGEPWGALRRLKLRGRSHDRRGVDRAARLSFTDEDIERLAHSGMLEGVESLNLSANMLTDLAAMALADSGMLGQLRELRLGENQIGDAGLIALIERGGMDKLELWSMGSNLVGDAGAAAIASEQVTPRLFCALLKGGLSSNRIGLAGVQALLRSPHIHELDGLWFVDNALTGEDVVILAADPALANLRGTFNIRCEEAHEETWQALIDSPYASQGTRDDAARLLKILQSRTQRGQG